MIGNNFSQGWQPQQQIGVLNKQGQENLYTNTKAQEIQNRNKTNKMMQRLIQDFDKMKKQNGELIQKIE